VYHRLWSKELRNSLEGICILFTWFCSVYFLLFWGVGEGGYNLQQYSFLSISDTVSTNSRHVKEGKAGITLLDVKP
jgi:hypothetical protein